MKFAQDIILKPVITEKSMDGISAKRYTFKVAADATKPEIAKAVEELFGVEVAKVNTRTSIASGNAPLLSLRHSTWATSTAFNLPSSSRSKRFIMVP